VTTKLKKWKRYFEIKELKAAGFSAAELNIANYKVNTNELLKAGFTSEELKAAGFK